MRSDSQDHQSSDHDSLLLGTSLVVFSSVSVVWSCNPVTGEFFLRFLKSLDSICCGRADYGSTQLRPSEVGRGAIRRAA